MSGAPWIIEGAIEGGAFDGYVETPACPTLGGGDIVILDNLSVHKSPPNRHSNAAAHGSCSCPASG